MKKSALTVFLFFIANKSVSACSYISGSDKPFAETLAEITFYKTIYFVLIFLLFVTNAVLLISREKMDYLFAAFLIGLALVMLPLTFFGMLLENCDPLFSILKWELVTMGIISAFHLALWVTKTGLPDWQFEKDKMISLKIK